jgi:hypothetical protein
MQALGGSQKEGPVRILAELVAEDSKASRSVTEATGGLSRWKVIDKIGSKGFILPMRGIRWLQEEPSHSC